MSVWLLQLEEAQEGGELVLPLADARDFTKAAGPQDIAARLRQDRPGQPPEAYARQAGRIWKYTHAVQPEDILAVRVRGQEELRFAQAVERVRFQPGEGEGAYLLPVRWFDRRAALSRFRRHREFFEESFTGLREIDNAALRIAIRDRLPLSGNRFRRWKWLLTLLFAMQMLYFLRRMMRTEFSGW